MNILILGDSWGSPNYYGPDGKTNPSQHTEWLLRKQGYTVHNLSRNGGSNYRTLTKAYYFLTDNCWNKCDWILWFHTEALREYFYLPREEFPEKWTIEQLADISEHKAYSKLQEIQNISKCKLAVIGGCSPIDDKILGYVKPDFLIKDWKSEILGEPVPFSYIWSSTYHLLDNPECVNSAEEKLSMLNTFDDVQMCIARGNDNGKNLFPDHAHPGFQAHADLVAKLVNVFV